MATMFPAEVEQFVTEGEKYFYSFLQDVVKPDGGFVGWYSPDINGREPDFILFSRELGLIIFEVKDWTLDQIIEADPKNFKLLINSSESVRKNPAIQVREYFASLMSKLSADGRLTSKDSQHYGKPRIPVSYGIVLTNIVRHEFEKMELGSVIPMGKTFFWDDMHAASDLCSDSSGQKVQARLRNMFPLPFRFEYSAKDLEVLKNIIFPTVRIEPSDRGSLPDYEGQMQQIRQLDMNQEAIARNMGGGHRIISGPSGSGKTLILVNRAEMLFQYDKSVQRVLFVCYNLTLVSYIQRLLAKKKVPLGEGGVEVCHFYDLCERIIGDKIANEGHDTNYYKTVIEYATEALPDFDKRYDAILVDEGQDFSDDMLKLVFRLLDEKSSNLMIAMDKGQRIYDRRIACEELGIKFMEHELDWVYRNSKQIAKFAERYRYQYGEAPKSIEKHELAVDFKVAEGITPQLPQFADMELLLSSISEQVRKYIDDGYPASEIAVLYTSSRHKELPGTTIPQEIKKRLQAQGILSQWVSENARSKENYDITTERITVSSIHSVKGVDYACVILLGADIIDPISIGKEQAKNLLYVGMTRARRILVVPWIIKSRFVDRLISSL
jgi:hypothetical protein